MLIPNNKQKAKLFQYANTARFAYNWALGREQENYKNGGKFICEGDLRKEYLWLKKISNNVPKQAIKDACTAYQNFFNGVSNAPRFKSKKHSIPKFYQDTKKIKFTDTHVKVEGFATSKRHNKQKLNWIRLAEHCRIPTDCKHFNPRIKYDGLNWYLTVGIEYKDKESIPSNEGIGIDLGIKDLAICSDKNKYKNINKSYKVKRLEKKLKRQQRSLSRKYENLKKLKKGEATQKANIRKQMLKVQRLYHRIDNIRTDYINKTILEIVKTKPSYITIEDLNVKGMMKNRHLSKAIQQQSFGEFRRQIEYKSKWNNTKVIIADRFFPSSRLCSCCGKIKKDLKLSDRIYRCECGNIIDRDYQAAINLKQYGEMRISV